MTKKKNNNWDNLEITMGGKKIIAQPTIYKENKDTSPVVERILSRNRPLTQKEIIAIGKIVGEDFSKADRVSIIAEFDIKTNPTI